MPAEDCGKAVPFLTFTASPGDYERIEDGKIAYRFKLDGHPPIDAYFNIVGASKIKGEVGSTEHTVTSVIRTITMIYSGSTGDFSDLMSQFGGKKLLSIQLIDDSKTVKKINFKNQAANMFSFYKYTETFNEAVKICEALPPKSN